MKYRILLERYNVTKLKLRVKIKIYEDYGGQCSVQNKLDTKYKRVYFPELRTHTHPQGGRGRKIYYKWRLEVKIKHMNSQ